MKKNKNDNTINKKFIITLVVVLSVITIAVIGISYAFFSASATSSQQAITTGSFSITYTPSSTLNMTNIVPIASTNMTTKASKITFSVKNNSSKPATINLDITNPTIDSTLRSSTYFKWNLYYNSSSIATGNFTNATSTSSVVPLISNIEFAGNETRTYILYSYLEDSNSDQNTLQGKNATFTIRATGMQNE